MKSPRLFLLARTGFALALVIGAAACDSPTTPPIEEEEEEEDPGDPGEGVRPRGRLASSLFFYA